MPRWFPRLAVLAALMLAAVVLSPASNRTGSMDVAADRDAGAAAMTAPAPIDASSVVVKPSADGDRAGPRRQARTSLALLAGLVALLTLLALSRRSRTPSAPAGRPRVSWWLFRTDRGPPAPQLSLTA